MATLEGASRRLSATRELHLTKFYFYQHQEASDTRRRNCQAPKEAAEEREGEADSAGWSSRGPRNRSSSNEPDSSPATTSSSAHSYARQPNQRVSSRKASKQATNESECELVIKFYSRLCEFDTELATGKVNETSRGPELPSKINNKQQQLHSQQQTISRSVNKPAVADSPLVPDGAKLSIEERLRRLLELEPADEQLRQHEINYPSHQMAHVVRQQPSAIASQLQNQLKLVAGSTKKCGQQQQTDAGRTLIIPADRMMIFMLASKRAASLNENCLAEKNRRVLKWLDDCHEATTRSSPS